MWLVKIPRQLELSTILNWNLPISSSYLSPISHVCQRLHTSSYFDLLPALFSEPQSLSSTILLPSSSCLLTLQQSHLRMYACLFTVGTIILQMIHSLLNYIQMTVHGSINVNRSIVKKWVNCCKKIFYTINKLRVQGIRYNERNIHVHV